MTMTQATWGKVLGATLALMLVAALAVSGTAFAQTTTDTNGTGTMQTATGTPGVPATGASVDPTTVVLVVLAAVAVAGGLGYLLTTPRATPR